MFLNTTKGQVLRYTLLPEVAPRFKSFIASGFQNLAYFMALVYRAVNLLPDNHLYLQTKAVGTFGVRDVLSAAASNLTFSVKHIDQVIIFFALIAGIVILGLQFILLLISFAINPASAAEMPANYAEFFTTKNPSEDLALRLLEGVFGLNKFWGLEKATGEAFHKALHTLFQFYSIGLLVIAAMIVIYFIFAILAETAQTGTPFGKRFNHVWAPLRLVAAIGLLIPIGSGLNSAQWITLHAAKFGSGFATNGWIKFNEALGDSLIIPKDQLIATPEITNLKNISSFMMIAHACKEAFILTEKKLGEKIDGWVLSPNSEKSPIPLSTAGYLPAAELSNFDTIKIRFGVHDPKTYKKDTSNVSPYCGEVTLTIPANPTKTTGVDGDTGLNGAGFLNARYYIMIQKMWLKEAKYGEMAAEAKEMMKQEFLHQGASAPPEKLKEDVQKQAKEFIEEGVRQTVLNLQEDFKTNKQNIDGASEMTKYGWGGAGIWYNKIAELNGLLTDEALNKPLVRVYPYPMELACKQNKQQNANTDPKECYSPKLSSNKEVQMLSSRDKSIAVALSDVFDFWQKESAEKTGNAFIDVINLIIGTQGLFDMCKNADIHPLAQLSAVGKGLITAAIRNLGIAGGAGLASVLPVVGPALAAASSFAASVASIGILIGFILYYIVPFLPFLYFLFAVGGWVKGLFEAMVGVPLWALSHIRIDGEGLPGDAAINGYFLIFEIFIRPILIVFGLLASILIFSAMVKILNEVFSLVVSNLSGFDASNPTATCGSGSKIDTGSAPTGSIEYFRGPVDEFFFTIVYAILVYMMAMSSFKLIDLIPNNILRWMGAGVSTFNDQAGEPADGLLSKMAIGGSMMGQQLQGAVSQGASAGGSFVKAATSKAQ